MTLAGAPKAVIAPIETGYSSLVYIVDEAPAGPATWVGTSPWLDSFDELASYVVGDGNATKAGWLVSPTSGLSGDLTVTTSATYDAGSATSIGIYVHDIDFLTSVDGSLEDALAADDAFNPAGTWEPTSVVLPVTSEMAAVAAAGRLLIVALIGADMRLSALTASGSTVTRHPHRLFGRGDKLRGGSNRLFGPGTRQSGGPLFGAH